MKTVKLEVISEGGATGAVVHGDIFSDAPDANGTTFICGNCDKPIIEGFVPGLIEMVGVDLVCQHCSAHNYLDTRQSN